MIFWVHKKNDYLIDLFVNNYESPLMVNSTTCPASKLLPTFEEAEALASEIFANDDTVCGVSFEIKVLSGESFFTFLRDGRFRKSTEEERGDA